jgi:HD superfamily phosphodiesterase
MEDLYARVAVHFGRRTHIAHDIKHATRTARLARHIAQQEGYDPKEAEIAGLLHDMGRAGRSRGAGFLTVRYYSELLA